MTAIDTKTGREALANLPDETSYGQSPKPEHVYLPRVPSQGNRSEHPARHRYARSRKNLLVERTSE